MEGKNESKHTPEDEKKVRVTFGLQPSDIEKIEVRIKAFDGALYSQGMWEWAAKDIGWHPLTAALYYFRYLSEQPPALLEENERLKEWKSESEKSLIESGTAIGVLRAEVDRLTKENEELISEKRRDQFIPDDIKKEAEEALKEHEGGNLSLWDVPHNAQDREYWKEVWTLGRMKSFR